MGIHWRWEERDALAAEEVQRRLPARLFDVHAHLYRTSGFDKAPTVCAGGPEVAGTEAWRNCIGRHVGEQRLAGGLIFPFPSAVERMEAANTFLLEELARVEDCRALVLISPHIAEAWARRWLEDPKVAGFKPYHSLGTHQPSFAAPISAFLPEWAWALADERGLVIMLHLVRRALADEDNLRDIRRFCTKYPRARLVLPHAASGFHAPNTMRGVRHLRGLENVWFDTSALGEATAIRALLREFGPRKVMWGSDFPVSERRGKCVTIGDTFAWVNPSRMDDHPDAPEVFTLPVGIENLRAVLEAAEEVGLREEDLKDLFCRNAQRLLGMG